MKMSAALRKTIPFREKYKVSLGHPHCPICDEMIYRHEPDPGCYRCDDCPLSDDVLESLGVDAGCSQVAAGCSQVAWDLYTEPGMKAHDKMVALVEELALACEIQGD